MGEPLIGLRLIVPFTAKIFSPYIPYLWELGWNKAECHKPPQDSCNSSIPRVWCNCGFYAMKAWCDDFQNFVLSYCAVALVEGAGRIVLHQRGWRSEWMRILAIVEQYKYRITDLSNPELVNRYHQSAYIAQVPILSISHCIDLVDRSNRVHYPATTEAFTGALVAPQEKFK